MSRVTGYLTGVDRNNPDQARSHLYATTAAGHLWPMCDYGWNRSDGARFSILRGWTSKRGQCRLCEARRASGRRPVIRARPHPTRWL